MSKKCLAEEVVRKALYTSGLGFVTQEDHRAKGLDFYLPIFDIHIEVKRFHSDRISEQMSRSENVIAIQGLEAANFFAKILKEI